MLVIIQRGRNGKNCRRMRLFSSRGDRSLPYSTCNQSDVFTFGLRMRVIHKFSRNPSPFPERDYRFNIDQKFNLSFSLQLQSSNCASLTRYRENFLVLLFAIWTISNISAPPNDAPNNENIIDQASEQLGGLTGLPNRLPCGLTSTLRSQLSKTRNMTLIKFLFFLCL